MNPLFMQGKLEPSGLIASKMNVINELLRDSASEKWLVRDVDLKANKTLLHNKLKLRKVNYE